MDEPISELASWAGSEDGSKPFALWNSSNYVGVTNKNSIAAEQRRRPILVSTYSDPDEARRQYLQNEAATRQLQMSVLEDQAIDWVVNAAKVTEQPGTFKDIMNFGAGEASEAVG